MPVNLKLSHKGLILVVILLAMELLFVGALVWLLNRAEGEARQESHSKEIVGRTNHLFQLFYDAGNAAADYQMKDGGKPAATRYHAAIKSIPPELNELKNLVSDDPSYLERVNRVASNYEKSTRVVSFVMDLAESGHMLKALVEAQRLKPVFSQSQDAMLADLRALMSEQEKILAQTPVDQERSRQSVKRLLFLYGGFNILAAIGSSLWFVQGITRRLDLVVDNTSRLTRHLPLHPALTGKDEIARLDNAFHEMAEALKEVELMKQEFVAMVSHDLKVPMTTIKVYLDLLSEGGYGTLTEQGLQRTQMVKRNVNRLMALISDLLDMEKAESGKLELTLETTDLASVVARSLDSVQGFAEEHHITIDIGDIATEEENGSVKQFVYADGNRLQQVLVNLLSNAVKFSPENSTVSVSASPVDDCIEVRVSDTGRGIPAAYQDAIFERFRQVKSADSEEKDGTGLGLAICKAIVEQHGGTIGVISQEGKGSTFWFRVLSKAPNH